MKLNKGFTLVEMLVVIAVLSVASMLILTIFTRTLRGGNKAQITESIKQNGQLVLELVDKTIRNAERVVCPANSDTTLVVVNGGLYTKFRFVSPTSSLNGYIQQETFNLPSAPPAGSDPNLYIRNFETTLCVDPMQNPQVITDTNPQSGASIYNGLFTRVVSAGFKDQVAIEFDVRGGVQAPAAVTGQIDPAGFQTTIQLR